DASGNDANIRIGSFANGGSIAGDITVKALDETNGVVNLTASGEHANAYIGDDIFGSSDSSKPSTIDGNIEVDAGTDVSLYASGNDADAQIGQSGEHSDYYDNPLYADVTGDLHVTAGGGI